MSTFARTARVFNAAFTPLLKLPVIGPMIGKNVTEISYTGRKSGKRFTLPVAFRRQDDGTILVGVAAAAQKTWWRNFQPGPAPVTITLDGVERTGTGVAKVGDKGTAVVITLDAG
ncbi:nitroreductase/quinone reductase family protein [Gordonia humi]|uniref:Nitroreductase family deazaflavin-dependent oxidoreductase n=1 Tax=Gordonia humi TaxID=686429 RepID=A0A840EWT6_9ACTN|nr:nitroreductase/quinone reductase family protein [Gordonia humi]MBB4136132.1 hypothetical protein [Gordonia humi]